MSYPTEEEFEHQRRVIREAYPRLFEAVEGQLRYVDEHLPKLLAARPKKSKYELALLAHLARASKTTLGIVRESEHGFGELAMASLRTLGETMVSSYWMSLEPDARADKFEGWAKIEALDTLKFAQAMGWDGELEQIPENLLDEEWVAAVKQDYPNPVLGWTQTPMKRVVDDIAPCWKDDDGKQLRAMLSVARLFGDRHSHVGAFDTLKYLSATEEGQLRFISAPGGAGFRRHLSSRRGCTGKSSTLPQRITGCRGSRNGGRNGVYSRRAARRLRVTKRGTSGGTIRAPAAAASSSSVATLNSSSSWAHLLWQACAPVRRVLENGYELDDDRGRLDRAAIHAYIGGESYWAKGRTRERMDELIEASALVVGLYAPDGAQVGFARAVDCDAAGIVYLADVYVLDEHRGRGLGVELVREIVEHGPLADRRWILHTRDAHSLYEKFSFTPHPRLMQRG